MNKFALNLPRTRAQTSEFLFGANVVLAAMHYQRRKIIQAFLQHQSQETLLKFQISY
jgi:hypothetical protein